jgi:predicted ribosomally synthesized peptide with nif11-like leader
MSCQVKAFLKKVHYDQSLHSELKEAVDGDLDAELESESEVNSMVSQIVDFAGGKGFDFSADEYKSMMTKLRSPEGKLSDSQLEGVSGGGGRFPKMGPFKPAPTDGNNTSSGSNPEPEFL